MRIELVPPILDHLPTVFSWRNETACRLHNPLADIDYSTFLKGYERYGSSLANLKQFDTYSWVALLHGEPAGSISLKGVSQMMGYAEIGYTVGEKFHGRGVGTAMVRELLRRVFEETELRKICALVHEENIASCRVLEKLGFQREGLLREHYILNGKPANEVFFGLLRSGWRG